MLSEIAPPDLTVAIRKLERLAALTDVDRDALRRLPYRLEQCEAGRMLIQEGQTASDCCILLTGYACRHKVTQDGKRQIVAFHMQGDFLDLQHVKLPRADHNVQMITQGDVAWIRHGDLHSLMRDFPIIADACWRDVLIEASVFREWVLNIGRRDARARLAHLLCEFAARRAAAGIGPPDAIELPMSQDDLADATGMTVVHVNRTLRALSAEGAIVHRGRQLRVGDWDRLKRIADFDPAYLHQAVSSHMS